MMRYSQAEKMEIIRLVEESDLSITRTLEELDVARSTFYRWYRRYEAEGYDGLRNRPSTSRRFWNKIPEEEKESVVETALDRPEMSPRELAWHITDSKGVFVSESSVYRILKSYDLITSPAYIVMEAADEFRHKTKRIHELWQTDFTYMKIIGWGWYYLSTILDDFSRYIIAWKLTQTMSTDDVKDTLDMAIKVSGVDMVNLHHKPRLLSDNGACYVSKSLQIYLEDKDIAHTRGKPYHPMTQGKIERYHRTMKNIIKLQNYYLPWELDKEIGLFVRYYNHERVHESLDNMTPADVYYGRHRQIRGLRDMVKEQTLEQRRRKNLGLRLMHEHGIKPAALRESVS
jgi:putative transposase